MKLAYDAVLFDLLTGLIDSWTLWDGIAGGVEDGRRWRARYLEITYGCGAYRPYEDLVLEAARDAGLPDRAAHDLSRRWGELPPWPDARGVLMALKHSMKIGVVTNCSDALGRQAAGLMQVPFDAVVTAEGAGAYKPQPVTYAAALKAMGTEPARTLFVAGSPRDVAGAMAAGMPVVWHNKAGLPNPSPDHQPMMESAHLATVLEAAFGP